MTRASAVETVRAGYGAVVAFAGPAVATRIVGRPLGRGERWIVRFLGARHVAQAALVLAVPPLAGPGALVDAGHAASLVGIAALSPRHRRLALADLPVATAFTFAEGTKAPPL